MSDLFNILDISLFTKFTFYNSEPHECLNFTQIMLGYLFLYV